MNNFNFVPTNIFVGTNIKLIRQSKLMKQSTLAKKLGISSVALSNIETSKSDITITRLFQIAIELDVGADLLVSDNLVIEIKNDKPGNRL